MIISYSVPVICMFVFFGPEIQYGGRALRPWSKAAGLGIGWEHQTCSSCFVLTVFGVC